ncbi:MAG: helix-turn-helix domain-containing protein [Bacilli bacterium]|jgi:hypothetical protein|nr:helix-turn-helix domain-containing protein [Bacilli bacterium]
MKSTILVLGDEQKMYDLSRFMRKNKINLALFYNREDFITELKYNDYNICLISETIIKSDLLDLINLIHAFNPAITILINYLELNDYNDIEVQHGYEKNIFLIKKDDYHKIKEIYINSYEEAKNHMVSNQSIQYYVEYNNQHLIINNNIINLTLDEQLLIELFITNKDMIYSCDELAQLLLDKYNTNVSSKAIYKRLSRLRLKIGINLIITVYGLGYQWNSKY